MQRSLVAGTSGTIARDENEKKTKARREGGDDRGQQTGGKGQGNRGDRERAGGHCCG